MEPLNGNVRYSDKHGMKTCAFLLVFTVGVIALAKEPKAPTKVPPLVGDEYEKTHKAFVKSFRDNQKSLEAMKKERAEIIERAKSEAEFFEEGLEALNKYDVLLVVRNTDDRGEYQKANEVAAEDVRNLNALFQKYLNSTLLPDRVSARHARKMINKAMSEIESRLSDRKDPDESNTPELEILAKRIEDSTKRTELVTEFASRIGIDLKREIASIESEDQTPTEKKAK